MRTFRRLTELALAAMICEGAYASGQVSYEFEIAVLDASIEITHVFVNSTSGNACLEESNISLERARFFDTRGSEVLNIFSDPFTLAPSTRVLLIPNDGKPHAFQHKEAVQRVFRPSEAVNNVARVEFEMAAYDCISLVSVPRKIVVVFQENASASMTLQK